MAPAGNSPGVDPAAPAVPVPGRAGHTGAGDTHLLAPYLPRLSIDWLAGPSDVTSRVERGTVVFVDISGFTKLSEGLARHGKVGGEELAATIGTCFVALLDLAVAYGGRLLKFGGDALLLYFSGEAHETRGCRAAVEMRRALRVVGRLTVLGQKVSLRMSVGIHSGEFHFFLVGGSHRELIVTGPAASTTVTMEGTADAGQIVVSPATAASLRPGLVGEAKGPGFLLRRAPDVPDDPFVPFEAVDAGADILSGIPVALREAVQARHQEPEHRRVTVAFIHFDGTDELVETMGPAACADQLDELVRNVQRAADRNQVTFLATDVDHDGGKIILTAGAPSTLGDDEHRMLLTLREVMDAGNRLPIRIGVNRGAVFVGEIGPPYRRTFTVMGDAVNLAARLMAKAHPGQIVAAPEVLSRSRTSFDTEELEPFLVKGKARPVRAFLVGEVVGEQEIGPTERIPFVGHAEAVAALGEWATEADGGSGWMVEVKGEAGVGKTRLVEEIRVRLADRPQLSVACQVLDSSTPYLVVRRLLRELLDLPQIGSGRALAEQFMATVGERAPDVLPWAPLIAQAVGLPVPDTDETRELDEEYRRPRLARAVLELLAGVLPASGLLCVDDAHLMDEASADLFTYLAASTRTTSWLIVLSRRPGETGFVAPDDDVARLDLGPLRTADALELARLITDGMALTPRQLDAIVDRSGGNPLFLRELVAATRGGGDVDELPETIGDVVTARIDGLSSDDRFLLRQLAVLGQTFPFDLARDTLEDLPHASDPAWRRLDEFVGSSGDTVSFRNTLVRDSAYDGLSYRLRRRIHNRAADIIRKTTWDGGDTQPEILSFHYLHGQRFEEAWQYALMAAERAKAVHANFEAADFFERAVVAGRRIDGLTTVELTRAYEELGDARSRTGSYASAAAAYRASRRLVRGDPVAEARSIMKLARVQGWLDRYSTALRWITKGLGLLDDVAGDDAARLRAELLSWYGRFCQEAGQHSRSIAWCTRAIAAAESAGELVALAEALRVLDWAKMELGRMDEPVNSERALAIYEELGDLHGQANTTNLLGMSAYWRGDWPAALDFYRRCLAIDRRTGNPVNVAFQLYNIGEISLDQGHLDEAEAQFTEASREWLGAGYRAGVASASAMLARVAEGRGLFDEAFRLFDEASMEFQAIGSHADALETEARLAECLLVSGDAVAALSAADAALSQARALGGVSAQLPLLHRVRGAALARVGDRGPARAALARSLEAARARGAGHEVALTLRVIADLDTAVGDDGAEGARREADATLETLGVVWTPDLFGTAAPRRARPGEA
jgi:class 3 adenylate cyclase/tetratricopeptide (TPR) repeat protein